MLLVATFSEMCALASRKYVAEQGMNVQTLTEKQLLWSNFSVFALE